MTEIRDIFIGKKRLHAYVGAVCNAMGSGDRNIRLVARGRSIQMAVDVAEVCRRRAGIIAGTLPEMVIHDVSISTEQVERRDGSGTSNVSCIKIQMEGIGEMNNKEEE